MDREVLCYFIGGPWDLSKRWLCNPERFIEVLAVEPYRTPVKETTVLVTTRFVHLYEASPSDFRDLGRVPVRVYAYRDLR